MVLKALVPTKAFGYPALFAGVAFLTQNAIDTLLTNSLARKYENPTPSMKGKTREGFWAWPKSPAQIDLTEFEQK